ncbi:hypothetical protein ONE63_009382 [Megalurothrips usitatus]|uniref:Uncharacterized protein n=1 Tax=Megalurothrips usitatus TaxID=439358 RepID=A0AAV7XJF2_9NEOP|nr:hypothetical protein ONE63_009382 [Megalurothrips usitatus]
MPLAATVKNHMLRLLRRSKSSRSPAMVIPNKQAPVSPSVIVEPFPMTLGSAAAPQQRHSHSSQHHANRGGSSSNNHHNGSNHHPAARSRSVSNRREVHRPHSSARRARAQVRIDGQGCPGGRDRG